MQNVDSFFGFRVDVTDEVEPTRVEALRALE